MTINCTIAKVEEIAGSKDRLKTIFEFQGTPVCFELSANLNDLSSFGNLNNFRRLREDGMAMVTLTFDPQSPHAMAVTNIEPLDPMIVKEVEELTRE